MLSGRRLNLLDPTPVDIEIEDIAHGLSRVTRWNGQTTGDWPYSVADHSVLVEQIFSALNPTTRRKWHLACLLHDAPEYVIGDMITPFKAFLGNSYQDIEDRLCQTIHIRFGLPGQLPSIVEKSIMRADKIAAYLESVQIAGFSPSEAKRVIYNPRYIPDIKIVGTPPKESKKRFLDRYNALTGDGGDTRT